MANTNAQPALRIENLRKTYRGGIEALRGVSIEVARGEFFALLGPNGAGKTTLIGIVASLVNKSAGSIHVFGKNADEDPAGVRSQIGLVPQEVNFNLWERVIDIIVNQAGYYGIPRREALERSERYLHQLDLWKYRNTNARALSGGFKRRLMVARALVHNPPLLILDEPTAGVDIELRRSMWVFLQQLNAEGVTIILTTHYLEEAESLCRKIAIIQHGRISEQGDMHELLESLRMETFVLDLARPLSETPPLEDFALRRIDDATLELDMCRGQNINDAFAQLSAAGVQVRSLRNKSNRLEEIFMRLVEEERNASRTHAS
ncbi:MAG: ABC transporter ATP-binding protein [Gammaproteobacteria bacterium]|nr:ABC transporter ATP-binding protein [Gammaproteobacteria bacterium]